MIEVALLLGLGAVGYMLAVDQPTHQLEGAGNREDFTMLPPRPTEEHTDEIGHSQASNGHNNEVPFFGARVTQSMYSGATEGILDTWTGAGKEYTQKREVKSFFDAKPGTGLPFRSKVETEFEQSRMVSGQNMKNVFPIQQVQVGPGANDGYTNVPKGGFQQDQLYDYKLPKTTDEIRIATKPKLSFEPDPVPGVNFITQPGIQAAVNKNKPDKFAVYGMDRANTAVGAQTAPRIYSEQPIKEQARETTSVDYNGGARGNAIFTSYIRAFTEPYQEFMKLTTEGRPGPAGAQGTGFSIGADSYSTQTKRDETVLSDATRINPPMQIINAHADSLGSYRYNEPLPQDALVSRNTPDILSAHQNNPYTQKLTSY
jgi:hypothetical protein